MSNTVKSGDKSDVEADPCMDKVEREICVWEYDGGDADTGVNAAWVCIACGKVNVNREPPSDY